MADSESLEVLRRVRQGDEQAAKELFDRYVGRLTALARRRLSPKLARRLDPEDVVQSAYRSFFHHVQDGRYQLNEAGDLWRLLAAITINKVRGQVKYHAAAKRASDAEQSYPAHDSLLGVPPEAICKSPSPVEANIIVEELEHAMAQLPEDYRGILELRLQGRSVDEIAKAADCSERKVHRVRQCFRRILEERLSAHPSS